MTLCAVNLSRSIGGTVLVALVWSLTMALSMAAGATSIDTREWLFAVSLDDKPIGHHRFVLREQGASGASLRQLVSKARFNVKVLFVNAYRYEHDAKELWSGSCLRRIEAHTDDNGTRQNVSGAREGERFALEVDDRSRELGRCVKTFAYWNPDILESSALLNPQTGDFVAVQVTSIGRDTLTVRGETVTAERYRIVGTSGAGEPLQIDLWYSSQKDWLALEALTDGGRRLRYRRQ